MPWVGDQLSPEDTSRMLRAYTSMAVAFAVCERLDADRLNSLLVVALSRQDDRHPQAGIDAASQAILEALGKW
jgi:sugar phosphate isomerase/epimerase